MSGSLMDSHGHPLLYGKELALEEAVAVALGELGFGIQPAKAGRHDITALHHVRSKFWDYDYHQELWKTRIIGYVGHVCAVEVKGGVGNIDVDAVRQEVSWLQLEKDDRLTLKKVPKPPLDYERIPDVLPELKGLVIANWDIKKPVEMRWKKPYSVEGIQLAKLNKIGLLLAPDLYYTLEGVRKGELDKLTVQRKIISGSGLRVISKEMSAILKPAVAPKSNERRKRKVRRPRPTPTFVVA